MYIFLDIDGVLNKISRKTYTSAFSLDTKCVKAFASFVQKCNNAVIVLISSWRTGFSKNKSECTPQIKALIEVLERYNISISDKTMFAPDKDRAKEIMHYLRWNNVLEYVILDDDPSEYKTHIENLYIINSNTGFTENDKKILMKRRGKRCF